MKVFDLFRIFLCLVFLLSSFGCRANLDVNELLAKVDSERSILNKKRMDLDLKIYTEYLDKFGSEIKNSGFEDRWPDIVHHVNSRSDSIECESLGENDVTTLYVFFRNFEYFNFKCLSSYSFPRDISFLLFYVNTPHVIEKILESNGRAGDKVQNTLKDIYDMAFVYCDQSLIDYLNHKGIYGGYKFTYQEQLLRERSDLHSCL